MNTLNNFIPLIKPLAFILGGLIAAYVVELIVLKRLRRKFGDSIGNLGGTITGILKGFTFFFIFLIGLSLGISNAPIGPTLKSEIIKGIEILFIAGMTIIGSRVAVHFVRFAINKVQGVLPSISLFTNLTRVLIWSLGGMIILQSLGISITPILTALGVFGLAVALALQDTLSNLFGGIQILLSRQVRPNDFVRLENGMEGFIQDISWRYTIIKTMSNQYVIVPNSKLSTSILVNANLPDLEISVTLKAGVSYESDLNHVERVAIASAKNVITQIPGGVPDFEPVIRYTSFGDSAISFNLVVRVREYKDQFIITHELIKALHRDFKTNGVEIPYPITTVYLNPPSAERK